MEPFATPEGADGALGPSHLPLEPIGADFVPLRLIAQPGGSVIEVDRPDVLVGRHTEADVRLPLPDVSRRHCRLMFIEGCWQVIDLHSLNGVHVNGEAVLQSPLEAGDVLRVGGFTFVVELGIGTAADDSGKASVPGHVHSIFETLARRLGDERRAS